MRQTTIHLAFVFICFLLNPPLDVILAVVTYPVVLAQGALYPIRVINHDLCDVDALACTERFDANRHPVARFAHRAVIHLRGYVKKSLSFALPASTSKYTE